MAERNVSTDKSNIYFVREEASDRKWDICARRGATERWNKRETITEEEEEEEKSV